MSNAPRADLQALRDPAGIAANALAVLQSVVPSSDPGSGVPVTAACHSAFDGSRLPELSHAARPWNHVMLAGGCPPGPAPGKGVAAWFGPGGGAGRVLVFGPAAGLPPPPRRQTGGRPPPLQEPRPHRLVGGRGVGPPPHARLVLVDAPRPRD